MRVAPEARRACDVAFAASFAACAALLALGGVVGRKADMIARDDFSKIWAAPRAFVTGHDPYDPQTWHATAIALGTFPPDTAVSLYPPWVALVLAPLALVPLPVATIAWTLGGLAVAALAVRALMRASLPDRPLAHAAAAATLVVSGPAVSDLLTGQWGHLFVATTAVTILALQRGRGAIAAVAATSMIAKPQLFVFAAPALALAALWPSRSGERPAGGLRFVAVALALSAAIVGVSWILMPSWWPAWPERITASQLTTDSVTIPGLLIRSLGAPGVALTPLVLLGAVGAGLAFHPRGRAWPAVWLALSLAATPYSNPYDLVILVTALGLGAAAMPTTRAGEAVFLAGAAVLLIGATLLHDLGLLAYAPLVPAAMFGVLVVTLWPHRRLAG